MFRRSIRMSCCVIFFFKQKTAYEISVRDWSSDVCSSDLGGVLLGMPDPREKPGFDDSVNPDFTPVVVERALSRFPILERATIKNGWAGLYEDTPDKHPILGPVDDPAGFVCAAGFSGHGVMHAPVTGELIAELIVDGRTSLDIGPLSAARFRSGELVREHNVI